MVPHARIHVTELFRVTLIAAVLTVRGLGTPGVLARDAACRDKLERCVLRQTQAVEEQSVPLFEAKRKTATLGCKLHVSCILTIPYMFHLNSVHTIFDSISHFVFVGRFIFCILCFSFYDPKHAV